MPNITVKILIHSATHSSIKLLFKIYSKYFCIVGDKICSVWNGEIKYNLIIAMALISLRIANK